jgi:hypothetical protein
VSARPPAARFGSGSTDPTLPAPVRRREPRGTLMKSTDPLPIFEDPPRNDLDHARARRSIALSVPLPAPGKRRPPSRVGCWDPTPLPPRPPSRRRARPPSRPSSTTTLEGVALAHEKDLAGPEPTPTAAELEGAALGASSNRSTNANGGARTRRRGGPRPELAPIAAELRALMRSGASLPVAASKLGMDADRAREVLAEWPASFAPVEPSRGRR